MNRNLLAFTVIITSVLFSSLVRAYDEDLAASYQKFFSSVDGKTAGKALHFASPESFIKDIKAGKEIVAIDIRTPAEAELFTLSLPNSLVIPANKIFEKDNLARIPTDKPVMIICKSGARATAIGTALRHIGFDNTSILKGGFQGLSSYYGPKQAYE